VSVGLTSLGARFGFELEDEVKEAASCDEVKIALGNKVSRERIGHEVNLISTETDLWVCCFCYTNWRRRSSPAFDPFSTLPITAMRCMEQLHLFPVVFTNMLSNIKPPLEENIGR
jgi:hypothetical protein